jgi:hypothetical protein
MDVLKASTGRVDHMPTSRMPGNIFHGFCAEELGVPGVPKPNFFSGQLISGGIVTGTHIGYIYAWGFLGTAGDDFAALIHQLTQVDHVDGLILDLRFNEGGFADAPRAGLSELVSPVRATIAMDGRADVVDHFAMKPVFGSGDFLLGGGLYGGRVAVLVGPGAVSAGDIAAELTRFIPASRSFGESTSMALGLPSQPVLGSDLDLGPAWDARVAETNSFEVATPGRYLTHREFPVDQHVWLRPADVAAGRDTVVKAALRWLQSTPGA